MAVDREADEEAGHDYDDKGGEGFDDVVVAVQEVQEHDCLLR